MEKYQFAISYPSFLTFLTELASMHPDKRDEGLFAEILRAAKAYKIPSDDVYALIAHNVLDKIERHTHKSLPNKQDPSWSDICMCTSYDLGKQDAGHELLNYIDNTLRPHYDTYKYTAFNVSAVADCDEWICSHCGLHLSDWTKHVYDEDTADTTYPEYSFKFCPECGHKVVDRYDE